jgi:hypothetical protein
MQDYNMVVNVIVPIQWSTPNLVLRDVRQSVQEIRIRCVVGLIG